MITGIKKEIRSYATNLYVNLLNDSNQDYKNTVILAGVGRSGTTWIANTINYNLEYRQLFEPFNPLSGIINHPDFINPPTYIRPKSNNDEYLKIIGEVLSGTPKSIAIDYENFGNRKFTFRKRLVKAICANLYLKYIKVNFPEIPIVLILRHPCAVAVSRIRRNKILNRKWRLYNPISFCQEHPHLTEDYLIDIEEHIKKIESDFENYIFQWCINNYVPLKQFSENEIHVAFYENFLMKPEFEIRRLFTFLNKEYNKSLILEKVKIPSVQALAYSEVSSGFISVNSWKKYVDAHQIKVAHEILNLFNLDEIYTHDSMPNMNSLREILANK